VTHNPDLAGAAFEGYRQSMLEKFKKRPINLKLVDKSRMPLIDPQGQTRNFHRINQDSIGKEVIKIII
jgi:hypothetical protein